MSHPKPVSARAEATRARLEATAVELFEVHGYEGTTTAMIAASAGVSEMTFFRHFRSKEGVLFDDPYDPLIVQAIAAQPTGLPPIRRVSAGLRAAWAAISLPDVETVRRRVRIAGTTPSLRAGMWANMARTEDGIVEQLVSDGTPEPIARMASAAVLAAMTAALTAWAADDSTMLGAMLSQAFDVIDGASRA
ncbi:TetR/AcrR family transcriptional regulator [Agromyces italicus]|uniref:TetR/AcrR family transcriptional regulator n=1 Tax=Agromyces italicus TaxID=279572 RepID=UPI0003B3ABBA|nr:TetR/AcrR family transcriptional regulator [Agromyces italicus]